jgi:hypothetical protein
VKPVDTPVHVFVADGNLDTISSMLYEEESGRCRVCCIFKFAESALRTWTTMEMERDNEKNMDLECSLPFASSHLAFSILV